jgi:hypothetical protein
LEGASGDSPFGATKPERPIDPADLRPTEESDCGRYRIQARLWQDLARIYAGSKVPNAATKARTIKPEASSAIVVYRKALIACRGARSIRGTKM